MSRRCEAGLIAMVLGMGAVAGAGEKEIQPTPAPLSGVWDCRSQIDGNRPVWGLLQVEREPDQENRWIRHLPDGRRETIGRAEDGSLVVLACADPEHNAWTVYQPPIPLWAESLKEGQEIRRRGRVEVYELMDRTTLSRSGTYEITLGRMKDESIRQDDRQIPCRRFRSRLDLSLGMIQVTTDTVECYDGRGVLVASQSSEKVQAWVTLWSRRQTLQARLPQDGGREGVALGFARP